MGILIRPKVSVLTDQGHLRLGAGVKSLSHSGHGEWRDYPRESPTREWGVYK